MYLGQQNLKYAIVPGPVSATDNAYWLHVLVWQTNIPGGPANYDVPFSKRDITDLLSSQLHLHRDRRIFQDFSLLCIDIIRQSFQFLNNIYFKGLSLQNYVLVGDWGGG